ncbi:MAG: hypothetical protein ACR2PZ_00340 [Pseudomonadales bacterium]
MALYLQKHGILRVYPVAGGMNRWIELGLPVEEVMKPSESSA